MSYYYNIIILRDLIVFLVTHQGHLEKVLQLIFPGESIFLLYFILINFQRGKRKMWIDY